MNTCPRCNSINTQISKYSDGKVQRRCSDCGRYFTTCEKWLSAVESDNERILASVPRKGGAPDGSRENPEKSQDAGK